MNHPQHLNNTNKRRLVLTVTNDLVTDNRAHKIATTLVNMGFDVTLTGRVLRNSPPVNPRNYNTHRMRLWFNKGPLFYANYNLALCFYLLFKRFDVVVSNDLDTLLACFVATEMTKKPLVYDSHEYFTEVPELVSRPFIKKRWEEIEQAIVPKLKYCYTVCQSIANIYNTKYGTNFKVVRNLPLRKPNSEAHNDIQPPFPIDKPVILYQGAVNLGRGIEEAIEAMQQLPDARLVIIGAGDELDKCKALSTNLQLTDRVIFTGRIPLEKLQHITPFATIGLSIEKDMGLNYRYALPNKLFDYIQCGIPVLTSELPEIKAVVDEYKIGHTIPETTVNNIIDGVNAMLSSPDLLAKWKQNCIIASDILCWENEEKIVRQIYQQI